VLGIKQSSSGPNCPWQNGEVERFNRTWVSEWAYREAFTTNADRTAALAPWLEHYNTVRRQPHSEASRVQPTVTNMLAGYP
jgi:transposase InsO family protein